MDSTLLKQIQMTELDILKDIDLYCRENKIMYSIYAGSMLGAVRHKGFIPWDDDVDIAMTRDEYRKFCNCIQKRSIQGYYFENYENDIRCGCCHGKIRKLNTVFLQDGEVEDDGHHEIWVDIFPIDKLPKNKNAKKIMSIGKMNVFLTRANVIITNDSASKRTIRFLTKLIPSKLRQKILINNTRCLESNYNKLCESFSWVSMSTIDNISHLRFPQDVCEQYTEIEFEGCSFLSFKEIDKMLTCIYGNYMELPAKEERICKHNPIKVIL